MTGGSIIGNVVNTLRNGSANAGGAIYGYMGDIYLRGGSITDNTTYSSSYACGGIAHDYASSAAQLHLNGTFTLSGNKKLSYDTNTHDWTTVVGSDYLHGNREYIILDGPISPTAPIAIELYSGYNKRLTTNWDTHMGTAEADGLFTLVDNTESNGMLIGVKDGNVQICTPEEVYWHIDANHDGSDREKAYIITTTEGLDLLAKHVNGTDGYTANNFLNKYFRLGKDITYTHKAANEAGADTENNFTAIGDETHQFSGFFDGAGHTISGIRIYRPDCDYQGLFGGCPHDVKNVILSDAVITGQNYVGGIAGKNGRYTENCIVRDAIITGKDYVGGIGGGDQGTYGLKFCFVERTNVVGVGDHAGAIVGYYPDNANALQYNYYHSCTRNTRNNTVSIGIGTGDGDSYDMYHGADAVFTITTADPISITAIEACRYQDVNYYYSVIGVTISAPGYTILSASYNDGSSDHTITPNGGVYTFSMPSSDITISASLTVNATQDITAYAGTVSGVTGYWATFYNGSLDYRLPAGAQAFTMDSNHHLYRLGTDGSIIPKNTAVILLSDTAAITLTKIDDSPTVTDNAPNGNILRAGPVTVMQGKVDGQYVYVLGIIDVNPTVIGFGRYIGPIIPANKAYYLADF